jgi:hypothetical protein
MHTMSVQVEVAFRDQTACRNALLLFTVLCHGLLEQQLANAYKELGAKRAEVRGGPTFTNGRLLG